MIETSSTYEYQVGGSLDSDAPSYVTREADSALYHALKAGQFCYVLNSRQMGKSSLRVRTMKRLQAEGTVCIFIDLTGMGKQDVTPEKWYAGIVQSLVSSCQLAPPIHWRTWWRERQDLLSPVQRLSLFIEEILLVEVKQNIVIFVDEIDRVLSQKFSLDDFFALIRCFLEQRDTHPEYKRLTWALLGVATPSNLIRDKTQTPFNIGKAIELEGFAASEVQPLVAGLKGKIECPEAVIKEILGWTGGQPFLTQKLCKLVIQDIERGKTSNPIPSSPSTPLLEKGGVKEGNPKLVEQVVKSRLVENWEATDEPEHLRTIRDRILRNGERVVLLLGLYQKILQQGEIPADGSPEQMELRLSGLVVQRQGKLKVYNRIYEMVFDQNWLERKLAELRPYASAINAWFASERQNESFLLRGQALQDALTWALGKSLGDLDYQYLVASQDLAKRQAQTALEAAEQASQLLASARQTAQQEVLKQQMRWDWMPKIALAVTALILLLRFSGLLQGLEWNLLDQFFYWRSLEPPDARIAIVTIDESDLTKVGQWPISDRTLAQAIAKIKAQNPRAIGLDLYRNLPVEPGHTDLVKLFQSTPNLFGIEKVVEPRIAPPPTLNQRHQVGFTDQVVDADSKVRRALLSVSLSDSDVRYSLAVKLALHYLKAEGVNLEELGGEQVRLGKAIFNRFEGNDGGYVRANSGGYQILLNFRGSLANFSTVSLEQVLNNQVPLNSFRSRLVIIGTTAESLNDSFYTPYSGNLFSSPQRMAGVTLHANIASQIISSALEGRPLLRTWGEPLEWLWILIWAGVGTAVSWRLKSPAFIIISSILASGGLLGGCYVAFFLGWWVPAVPSLLALLGAAVVLWIITNRQRDRLLFHLTFARLLAVQQDYPTVGRIAIEYLKQSETRENQVFMERQLKSEEPESARLQSDPVPPI
ncbi:MAG: CHASE2 domain-containing protein [Gloeobacterales cyanobacterium]